MNIFTETEFGENYIKFLDYRYSESKGEFELINEIIDSQDNKDETCTLGYFSQNEQSNVLDQSEID